MKLTKKDILSHSFVISIDEKRLDLFYKRMEIINFYGIKHVSGRLDSEYRVENLNKTTRDIVLYAKRNNFPYITIFEDDAYPIKNFDINFEECINNIPDDARCVSFGYNMADSIFNTNKNIKYDNFQNCTTLFINKKDIKKCWGSHSYIIFKSDYDRFIKYLNFFNPYDREHKTDTDYYLHKDNDYFYVKRIPLFLQQNIDDINNVHKEEGNKGSKKLNDLYHLL